ncbi:MMPL family transporter [Thiocapsa rosea]|uniref:Putative exporter n=1 Tax=Thiocapsa rosea TaxID=69360 RepID=A0A495V206_9GAMM|nr:MMPL family transporter [Thiocapsa rosea]RKT43446.1 putative exporter [Thiocapsa rosea]
MQLATLKRRSILLTAWLVVLGFLALWNGFNLRPSTDLSQFLPRGVSLQDEVLLSQVRSGVAARTLLLRIGGERPAEALADASRALAARLRNDEGFQQVANGELDLAIRDTDPDLFRYRYLIGPHDACVDALTEPALRAALEERLAELASGAAMLDKERFGADPTACYRHLLHALIPQHTPDRRHGVWFSPDGDHVLMVVVTDAQASDLAAQRRAVEHIRDVFDHLPEGAGLTLDLAGPGYFAVGSEQRIKTETLVLSIAAGIATAGILALAFRSAALVLLGMLPLLSGVMVGAALVSWVFGSVHGITLALGVTLLGVALDYPVHVYAHAAGADDLQTKSVWRTLLLGMATTVLGYAALAWTSFEGLSQLGVLAAAGLITAALTSRYLLPALMPDSYRLPERRWLAALQARRPHWSPRTGLLLLLLGLAGLGLVVSIGGNPWETDIRRLSTVPQAEIEKDSLIRAQLGAPDVSRLLYVVADDEADVLERLEAVLPDLAALQAQGLIGGFDTVARWLPSPQTQAARRAALPERAELTARLAAANAELPFRLERLAPFLDDVEASRDLEPLRAADLARGLIGTRVSMLLQPLGDAWLGLVPLSGVGEDAVAPLQALAEPGGIRYLDLREGTAELLAGFFTETLDKFLLAALVIALALALALRGLARIGLVLLPIVIALVWTFTLLILIQGSVNLFHLVSLLLVAGLAVDYSLFLNRPAADEADRLRSLLSVSVGAGSSFAMFGFLALSAIPALQAIGLTVTLGILCAYVMSLLLARAWPVG